MAFSWGSVHTGDTTSVIARHVCSSEDGQKHVFQMAIRERFMLKILGELPTVGSTMTFLDAQVVSKEPMVLQITERTEVFDPQPPKRNCTASLNSAQKSDVPPLRPID